MVFAPKNMTINALLVMVYEIIGANPYRFVYELKSLFKTDDNVAKSNTKNDRDLHYVLVEANVNPEVYVTVQQFRQLHNDNHLSNA